MLHHQQGQEKQFQAEQRAKALKQPGSISGYQLLKTYCKNKIHRFTLEITKEIFQGRNNYYLVTASQERSRLFPKEEFQHLLRLSVHSFELFL